MPPHYFFVILITKFLRPEEYARTSRSAGRISYCGGFTAGPEETSKRYSVNTTDCTPEISNRFRQRTFLHAIMSSLRSM